MTLSGVRGQGLGVTSSKCQVPSGEVQVTRRRWVERLVCMIGWQRRGITPAHSRMLAPRSANQEERSHEHCHRYLSPSFRGTRNLRRRGHGREMSQLTPSAKTLPIGSWTLGHQATPRARNDGISAKTLRSPIP